jgi:PKHD-type hydroxylase
MLLNDGFEGGELQLQHPRKSEIETIPLVKGSIVAFPSYVLHRVTPIISGRRRSATLWLNGPRFR